MDSRNSTASLSAQGTKFGPLGANRFMSLPVVIATTGVSRSSIYSWVAAGTFPKPKKLGPRKIGWLAADVDAWVKSREAT